MSMLNPRGPALPNSKRTEVWNFISLKQIVKEFCLLGELVPYIVR